MASEGEGPSPDEVQRWVNRLYDRAESDTGKYNATRAASIPRQRNAATRGQSQEGTEPTAGTFTRKWFETARAALGPIVPARLPDTRPPVRPDRAPESVRPVRPEERPAEPLALEAPEPPTGVARELTGGTAQSPTAAQSPTTGPLPEIPAQRVAPALPGESRRDENAGPGDALPVLGGDAAAWPLYEPVPAPAPESGPLPGPLPGPRSTLTLPTVPGPTAGTLRADLPTSGTEAYGAGPATTGATALYPMALPADPTAHYTSASPAGLTTATYDPGLPDVPAAALTAPAPPAPTETAAAPAPSATFTPAPSAPFTPGAYGGSWLSPDSGHRTRAERVIAFARAQVGRPCVWGAVGPGSYDAPGLTQAAWKAAGVTLSRTAQAQWEAGTQVSLADAQVGDLVFFHDDLGHVGIWSGVGMMIHAPGPGAFIREESVFFAGQSAIKGAVRPA
ncbi:NlpC/P60 family protein [Streptomyces violaceus]|uniref:C40 family peptidase n=1 Tax=Streptomyces violaceus TaxID=1936 RepID=UPI002E2A907D|nr:NlpC/P60 family protein [Streptomyces violaceus]